MHGHAWCARPLCWDCDCCWCWRGCVSGLVVGAARLCAGRGAAAAAVQPKVSLSFTSKHSCFHTEVAAAVAVPVLPWPACRNIVWTCDPVCSAVTLWACCLLCLCVRPHVLHPHNCVHTPTRTGTARLCTYTTRASSRMAAAQQQQPPRGAGQPTPQPAQQAGRQRAKADAGRQQQQQRGPAAS